MNPELHTHYPVTGEARRREGEIIRAISAGRITGEEFAKAHGEALANVLKGQQTIRPVQPASMAPSAFQKGRFDHKVVVAYDHKTKTVTFGYLERNPFSALEGGVSDRKLVITSEAWAQHAESRTVLAMALEGREITHTAADAIFEAWVEFEHLANGLGVESASRPEAVRFPETADPVLARLEAEIAMCEDLMQKARLEAIFASLKKFAPVVPSDA